MSEPDPVSGVFARPFAEQVAYFRNKLGNLVPTQRWDDMLGAEHDAGFMVAGAAKADLLADLAAAVDKAITEGRGIEEFRRDFRNIVGRYGWTGWTGEGSVKGEAWRVKTILRTNATTSYAAGRFVQLQEFPIWVYRHGDSREPRPEHLSWDGVMLEAVHEFWKKHYPPSEWGCSCYVVGARSEAGAKRLGGVPGKQLPGNWRKIDPKTGEPVGIGKGWGYAPGASVSQRINALAAKIGSWDYQIAKAFMGELKPEMADALAGAYRALHSTADDVRRYAQRVYEPKPDLPELSPQRTLGRLASDQAKWIDDRIGRDPTGFDFSLDQSGIRHVISHHSVDADERKRGQRGVTAADFAMLPQILGAPDRMELSGVSPMGEQIIDFAKQIGSETYVASMVVRGDKRRTLALKTMYIQLQGKRRAPAPTS